MVCVTCFVLSPIILNFSVFVDFSTFRRRIWLMRMRFLIINVVGKRSLRIIYVYTLTSESRSLTLRLVEISPLDVSSLDDVHAGNETSYYMQLTTRFRWLQTLHSILNCLAFSLPHIRTVLGSLPVLPRKLLAAVTIYKTRCLNMCGLQVQFDEKKTTNLSFWSDLFTVNYHLFVWPDILDLTWTTDD